MIRWLVVLELLSLSLVAGAPRDASAQSSATDVHPNEPPGFKILAARGFDAKVEDGWKDRGDARFRIVADASAPVSPPMVGEAVFPAGFRGGGGPISTWLDLTGADVTELYISFWMKLSVNFAGAPSAGINKIFHIWMGQKSVVVFSAQGRGGGMLRPQMRLQNVQTGRRGVSFNLEPRQLGRSASLTRGQWQHLEILLRLNSPGAENGSVEWWLDGQLAGDYPRVGFRRLGSDDHWTRVSWNPTWGAPKDRVNQEFTIRMDQIYVSGR